MMIKEDLMFSDYDEQEAATGVSARGKPPKKPARKPSGQKRKFASKLLPKEASRWNWDLHDMIDIVKKFDILETRGLQVKTLWLNSFNTVQQFTRWMKLRMKKIRLRSRGEDKFYKASTLLIKSFLCFSRDAYSKLVQRRSEYESSGSEAAEISYNAQIKVRMCSSNRWIH